MDWGRPVIVLVTVHPLAGQTSSELNRGDTVFTTPILVVRRLWRRAPSFTKDGVEGPAAPWHPVQKAFVSRVATFEKITAELIVTVLVTADVPGRPLLTVNITPQVPALVTVSDVLWPGAGVTHPADPAPEGRLHV